MITMLEQGLPRDQDDFESPPLEALQMWTISKLFRQGASARQHNRTLQQGGCTGSNSE